MGKRSIVLFLLMFCMLGVGCKDVSNTSDINRITYTSQPAWGMAGEMIQVDITLNEDGQVEITEKTDSDRLVSQKRYTISQEETEEIFETLEENDFYGLSDDLTDPMVLDGSYAYLEVVTENGTYKKGGLNPTDKRFEKCSDAMRELRQRAEEN